MLCQSCETISLELRPENSKGKGEGTKTLIRKYANVYTLRDSANSCDFCGLIYEEAQSLEADHRGPYCKQRWGKELTNYLLDNSPIRVYHVGQNVKIKSILDAQNAPDYNGGPIAYEFDARLGGLCVQPESAFASAISGRTFSEFITKAQMSTLARTWFDRCAADHVKCREARATLASPKRLLRVSGCTTTQRVRLAISTDGLPQGRSYACLSYCWGKRQELMLTHNTIERFASEGVHVKELPATIRDACELCDALAIPYLFVDSLCILQDSLSDWEVISQQMCEIYSSAVLTIAAAAGKDCREGLLASRRWESSRSAELRCADSRAQSGTCLVRGKLRRKPEPLDLRGWAMQEDLLSPKLLRIGTAEMSWHCSSTESSESEAERAVSPQPGVDAEAFLRPMSISLWPRHGLTPDLWRALVRNYSRRKLSLEKDKLPAISGVAFWMSTVKSSALYQEYLAGLWNSRLPKDLLWYHDLPFPADEEDVRLPSKPRAPSWSWAAYDCPHLEWVPSETSFEYTKRLSVTAELVLNLQGPFKRGWLVPNNTHPEQFDFWDHTYEDDKTYHLPRRSNNCLGRARLDVNVPLDNSIGDSNDLVKTRSRACMCLRIVDTAGLLVESTYPEGSASSTFCRLGLVQFKVRSSNWWSDAMMETIRLI